MNFGDGGGRLLTREASFIFKGDFDPRFSIDLMYKDMELVIKWAKDLGMPLFLVNTAQRLVELARAYGLGNKDASAVIRIYEKLFSMEVRGEPPPSRWVQASD